MPCRRKRGRPEKRVDMVMVGAVGETRRIRGRVEKNDVLWRPRIGSSQKKKKKEKKYSQ